MNNQWIIAMIVVGAVFWVVTTLLALKKNKILALTVFFAIPTVLICAWILTTIIMLSISTPTQEKKFFESNVPSEPEKPEPSNGE